MAVGDIYKLDLLSTWDLTIKMRNTFFYSLNNPVSGVAERCFEAFEEDILAELVSLAPTHVTFDQIDVVCVRTPTDYFSQLLVGVVGDRVTDPVSEKSPSFLTCQFVGNRAGPGTRNARKRFSFLYEGDVNGNFLTAAFQSLSEVTDVETAMAQNISFASIVFSPVVVAHPIELGIAPVVKFPITSYILDSRVSTQTTRKS